MAFDSTAVLDADASLFGVNEQPIEQFRRAERLVVVVGAAGLGAMAGVGVAFALGRSGMWPLAIAAPFYLFALYLAMANFSDAAERRAFGCAVIAVLVAATLMAWPVMAMLYPMSAPPFWYAPAAVIAGLMLSASCWSGAQVAIYRFSAQAMIVMAGVGFLGIAQALS